MKASLNIILVLPLTILLSSIMVFGSLSENYEFAAMKASGISLQRSMKSLIFFTFILGIVTFFFSNNVAPIAEYNFHGSLLYRSMPPNRSFFERGARTTYARLNPTNP